MKHIRILSSSVLLIVSHSLIFKLGHVSGAARQECKDSERQLVDAISKQDPDRLTEEQLFREDDRLSNLFFHHKATVADIDRRTEVNRAITKIIRYKSQ